MSRGRSPPPPSLGALRPDLPPGVEQVVQVALAKDPAARFRTAEAMATALASALGTTRSSVPLPPVVHLLDAGWQVGPQRA